MVSLEDIKLPPHNIEAEKGVLSWVFLDNDQLFTYDALGIEPQDFYKKEHQIIFDAMKKLWVSRRTIDVLTIGDELVKMWLFESVGWQDYLLDLSGFLLSTSSVGEYAKIVKEKSILRRILKVCQAITWDVYDQKEAIDILEQIEKRIYDLTQINTSQSTKHIREILTWRIDDYMEIVDNPQKLEEMKTLACYKKLDEMLGWFRSGDLVIVAARPSMGKTAFALNLLGNIALKQKKTVAFFSLEMGASQIVDRVISMVSEIPMFKITKWLLDGGDFTHIGDAVEKIGESNIFIDDKGGATITELKSKLRRLKIEHGRLDFVIIDYLQLMSWSSSKFAGNRVQEISEISRWLKELARELEIPIIALSQLSRGVEQRTEKKPQLSDLRESGAIEQDADSVLMLYREDYYDPDTDEKNIAEILVRKNRNGPTGEIKLLFQREIQKFFDITDNQY